MDVSPIGQIYGRPHIEVLRLREDRASIQRQVEDLFRLEDEAAAELLLIRHAEPARTDPSNEDPLLSCTGLQQPAAREAERAGMDRHFCLHCCGSDYKSAATAREWATSPRVNFSWCDSIFCRS